ncbi:MAG TPA: AbrB family transcriptional regulator [Acidobacteria bacterium]|nr:AbrB family transcriptional regulator [Acidobacteriota bacterium]
MALSTLTSKGQITLPREVREHLHIAEGDRVEFRIERDGGVRLAPVSGSVRDLYGCLRRADVPAPGLEDLEEALLESLAADDERIRRGGR